VWFPRRQSRRSATDWFTNAFAAAGSYRANFRRAGNEAADRETGGRTSAVAETNQNSGRLQIVVEHLPFVQSAQFVFEARFLDRLGRGTRRDAKAISDPGFAHNVFGIGRIPFNLLAKRADVRA